MDFKILFHKYLKFPLTFSILGIFTSSIAFSEIFLLLLNENSSFNVGITLFVLALFYLFIIWISLNDYKLQAMCGYISTTLIFAGIMCCLITPTWILQAHWVNKYAVFMTNFTAIFSALCFLWTKIISLIAGPPSRSMPITENHEGFVYVAANTLMCAFLSYISSNIETKTIFAYKKILLQRSYIFILLPLIYDFLLGYIVGSQRSKYIDIKPADDGTIVATMD